MIDNSIIEQEINKELQVDVTSGRKPFVVTTINPTKDKQTEMAIFTSAKKLAEYIMIITQKSPKKYRWSIVTKLQNASINLVEVLYQANFEAAQERKKLQNQAKVVLKLIDFYTETAKHMQAITNKQMLVIAKSLYDCNKLLNGWIKSTQK